MYLFVGQVTQTFAGDAVEEDEGAGDADFQRQRGVGKAAAELLPAGFFCEDGGGRRGDTPAQQQAPSGPVSAGLHALISRAHPREGRGIPRRRKSTAQRTRPRGFNGTSGSTGAGRGEPS